MPGHRPVPTSSVMLVPVDLTRRSDGVPTDRSPCPPASYPRPAVTGPYFFPDIPCPMDRFEKQHSGRYFRKPHPRGGVTNVIDNIPMSVSFLSTKVKRYAGCVLR